MAQQIINGFPQHFQTHNLSSTFDGTLTTQMTQAQTDIDLTADTTGDVINVSAGTTHLLSVFRDGVYLHEGEGYTLISADNVRVTPGLNNGERVEFVFLKAD